MIKTGILTGSIILLIATMAAEAQISLEENTDRPGMNLKPGYALSSIDDAWICASDCANNPNCKAFTYVKRGARYTYSSPECLLKGGVPNPVSSECCISGVMPGFAQARYSEANNLYAQGKLNESIRAFEEVIELDPNLAGDAWLGKGLALKSLGKYDEATKSIDKAIELLPNQTDLLIFKGEALMAQGKYDEAMQTYDKYIMINPQSRDAWVGRGEALKSLGKYDEAVQAFNKAIEMDPYDVYALFGKSDALKQLGKTAESYASAAKAYEFIYSFQKHEGIFF